jgi:SAM-dependent methyltransferase
MATSAPPTTTEQLVHPTGQPMWQQASPDVMRRAGELITGKFAARLIQLAGLSAPSSGSSGAAVKELKILDNACGSGIVTAELMKVLSEKQKGRLEVVCGDVQQGMVDYVKERVDKGGWTGVEVKLVDAQVWVALALSVGNFADHRRELGLDMSRIRSCPLHISVTPSPPSRSCSCLSPSRRSPSYTGSSSLAG